MICDDEIDLLEMFQVALSREYETLTLTVDSGKDRIGKSTLKKKVKNKKIDILLLDYKLGDIQGVQ
jgi:DNA-binding response OmpR family regulator